MKKRKNKAGKISESEMRGFNDFLTDLINAPRQLDESLSVIALLVHKLGGDVTVDLDEGARVRREYSVSTERTSENAKVVRLKLYAKVK